MRHRLVPIVFRTVAVVLAFAFVLPLSAAVPASAPAAAPESGEPALIPAYYIDGSADSSVAWSDTTAVPGLPGLTATLVGKDTLVMRRVLDLREMSSEDPLITVYPLCAKKGFSDYTTIRIDVVDVYDENNYFTISIKPYKNHENEYDVCYTLAYANNGQIPTALDRNGTTIHSGEWGTWSHLNFAGGVQNSIIADPAKNYISLCYDESEKIVYIRGAQEINYFVSDLDDIRFYGKNCWDGFTTGEVYCRLHIDDYVASSGSVLISRYGSAPLASEELINEKPPVLTVDYGEYEAGALPSAVTGKPYAVFSAKATDIYYGSLPVSVKVYTNYYASNRAEVNLKAGAFTPRIPVDHYIEYTAQGSAEEKTVVVVRVPIDTAYAAPSLEFASFPESVSLGDVIALPAYTTVGGSGKIDVSLQVTAGAATIPVREKTVWANKMAPMLFTYTLTDYLGTETVIQKTVRVDRATVPTFVELPDLPVVLIEGVPYTFPAVRAYNFVTAEGDLIDTQISVIYKGQTTEVTDTYTPAVENSKDTVTIRYTARVGDAVTTYEKTVPVYRVRTAGGRLDMTAYFETEGSASLSATGKEIDLTGSGVTDFRFINAVAATFFKTDFITGAAAGLDRFDVYLTDIADPDNVLKFTYLKSGSSLIFFVNDSEKQRYPLASSFAEKKVMSLSIDLQSGDVYYDVDSGMTAAVTTNLAGEPFTGFTSGKAFVRYHFEGGSYTLGLQTLNNQFLSNDVNDFTGPKLDVIGDYGGNKIKGDSILLPDVLAMDVLTGEAIVYVSIQRPDGSDLCDDVPLSSLRGPIELDEYGDFYVQIWAKDGNGRKSSVSFLVSVIDDQPPVFGAIPAIADSEVGKKVEIPRPSATDNVDGAMKVEVYISYPGGQYLRLAENYAGIIPRTAGVYTVVYVAVDSFGNRAVATSTFTVRKGE